MDCSIRTKPRSQKNIYCSSGDTKRERDKLTWTISGARKLSHYKIIIILWFEKNDDVFISLTFFSPVPHKHLERAITVFHNQHQRPSSLRQRHHHRWSPLWFILRRVPHVSTPFPSAFCYPLRAWVMHRCRISSSMERKRHSGDWTLSYGS